MVLLMSLFQVRGIEFDPVGQHLYWIDGRSQTIRRALDNGTQVNYQAAFWNFGSKRGESFFWCSSFLLLFGVAVVGGGGQSDAVAAPVRLGRGALLARPLLDVFALQHHQRHAHRHRPFGEHVFSFIVFFCFYLGPSRTIPEPRVGRFQWPFLYWSQILFLE